MKLVLPDSFYEHSTLHDQIRNFVKKMYYQNRREPFILSKNEIIEKVKNSGTFSLVFGLSKGDVWTNSDDHFLVNHVVYRKDERLVVDPEMFGLTCGIYINNGSVTILYDKKIDPNKNSWSIYLEKLDLECFKCLKNDFINVPKEYMRLSIGKSHSKLIPENEKLFLNNLFEGCLSLINQEKDFKSNQEKIKNEIKLRRKEEEEVKNQKYLKERKIKELNDSLVLENSKKSIISELDKDNNNEIDLIDGDTFNKLLNNYQKNIIEIDKNFIQKFVKISIYLKTKRSNTQLLFESIKKINHENDFNELVSLLKNQINTYELLVFHSISMITSLVDGDLITFYEIYESFDQLGVFNSNWENEVSNKLSDIGNGIRDLMYSINNMEYKIVNSINNLNYMTQSSFLELNMSVNSKLKKIDSKMDYNNILLGLQTYKRYNITI